MKHRPEDGESPIPSGAGGSRAPNPTLAEEPRVAAYFGAAYEAVSRYARMLGSEGERLGLIGPGEVGRLWSRHILNCAAVGPHLPPSGTLVDVGSGAGLPGVVLAAMRPDLRTILIEPMERRVAWLNEVCAALGLSSVEVVRGRAEDLHDQVLAEAVTARAVAPLRRLVPWTMPLLVRGGVLLAMKGGRAAEELRDAEATIWTAGGGQTEILTAGTIDGVDPTTLVRIVRVGDPQPAPARRRSR